MKKEKEIQLNLHSLTEVHRSFGLPNPQHPLISLINSYDSHAQICRPPGQHVLHFYKISYKEKFSEKIKYGQGYYDFDEGGLLFASPNQLMGSPGDQDFEGCSMYTLLIHPDFLWNYPLAKKIKQYGYFSYATHEALHLSEDEKETIVTIFKIIEKELNNRVDDFSQDVIISQIEVLLNYANRFYKRQFLTRKTASTDLLGKLEEILNDYFDKEKSLNEGIPTVQYLSDQLNISPSYLSDLLRSLTGQNAQQHIHAKLIEKAKEKLSVTELSVSEIAYQLGFEHSQSFNKLFKKKMNVTPLEFRQAFN